MAALIQALVLSGSRLSTGEPNDTGVVWAYQPGTTSPAILYADADAATVITQPIVLDNGGRIPYDTYPDGVWITAPIRLLVQDISGQTVTDSTYWPSDARTDALVNDGWTGDTVDEALTAIFASTGGVDGKYKESGGATARLIQNKFREIALSVKDFGAVGNGIAIDTTAIQTTINRIKALGGGIVYFPPGTYIVDQALTLSSANGVRFVGAGLVATILKSTNATANMFTIATCDSVSFEQFAVNHATSSTGAAFSLSAVVDARFVEVGTDGALTGTGVYLYALHTTGTSSYISVTDSRMWAVAGDATARGMLLTDTSVVTVFGGRLNGGSGYDVEFTGATGAYTSTGTIYTSAVRFAADLTGSGFAFFGGSGLALSVATAAFPDIRTYAAGLYRSATSSAVGNTQTPTLLGGNSVLLLASSGGAGTVTVASPAVLPSATDTSTDDLFWDFTFKNASGGAVTWTLNAVFVVASAIPTTDAHTIAVRFWWDRLTSKLRERSRADTVT